MNASESTSRVGAAAERRRVVVAGAGIAGLAAAHALTDLGYDVRVLERDRALREEGAGLTLWPNGIRALRALGLGEVVEERTRVLGEAVTLTRAGAVLTSVPLDRIGKRFGPLVSAHRADLLGGLLERFGGAVELGAEVSFADGAIHVDAERLDAELVIGADDIRSAVREAVAPGIAPRRQLRRLAGCGGDRRGDIGTSCTRPDYAAGQCPANSAYG